MQNIASNTSSNIGCTGNTSKTLTNDNVNLTFVYQDNSNEINEIKRKIKQLELELKIKQLELELAELKQNKITVPVTPIYPSWPGIGTPVQPWYDPYRPWCEYCGSSSVDPSILDGIILTSNIR